MKTLKLSLLLLCLVISSQLSFSQGDSPRYKDLVVENPEAEEDIEVVSSYVNALVNNKMLEAENLLSEKYIGYGPGTNDSISKQGTIKAWTETHQVRSNEKVGFVSQTFRVLQGDLQGDWVSQWGTYSFTQNGKHVELPYQLTARVRDGKINRSRIYFDNLTIAKSLGYNVIPPKE